MSIENSTFYYSPFSFIRGIEDKLSTSFINDIMSGENKCELANFGNKAHLYYKWLEWDSNYFDCPTYRIEYFYIDDNISDPTTELIKTLSDFNCFLENKHNCYYLFAELPSEDLIGIHAFGASGLRLIETRLTYFNDKIMKFDQTHRSNVRAAKESDIFNLKMVASGAVNKYDRFHADPFFTYETANNFLETFIDNSVRGFADIVLIPEDNKPPNAFITGKILNQINPKNNDRIGQMVLSAVHESRRGWYHKLVLEMSYWFKDHKIPLVKLTTQSTNRAVIRVWEKLGYRFGSTSHIFAMNKIKKEDIRTCS